MTYGLPNDDPEWVAQQRALGVRGVIVDDVAGVAAALAAKAAAAAVAAAGGDGAGGDGAAMDVM